MVLGLIIIGALIIVAVKQSESPSHSLKDGPDVDRIRNIEDDYDLMIDTIDNSTVEDEDTTTVLPLSTTSSSSTTTVESYKNKLEKLMGLILFCKKLMPDNEACDVSMTVIKEENIDDHISGLNDEIMKFQMFS